MYTKHIILFFQETTEYLFGLIMNQNSVNGVHEIVSDRTYLVAILFQYTTKGIGKYGSSLSLNSLFHKVIFPVQI